MALNETGHGPNEPGHGPNEPHSQYATHAAVGPSSSTPGGLGARNGWLSWPESRKRMRTDRRPHNNQHENIEISINPLVLVILFLGSHVWGIVGGRSSFDPARHGMVTPFSAPTALGEGRPFFQTFLPPFPADGRWPGKYHHQLA